MNFEGQVYRDKTAKMLKSLEKEDRFAVLKDLKLDSMEYRAAHYFHAIEVNAGIMESRIQKIVATASTLSELKQAIGAEELLFANEVSGIDHAEHLAKRIDMAESTGYVLFVPEEGGLAKKVEECLDAEGKERQAELDEARYQGYLQGRFSDMELTENDWQEVVKKIPAETFASVDVAMERPTILLNSIDETQSLFSCAGHGERAEKIAATERYFEKSYLAFATKQEGLLVDFQKEFGGSSVVSVEVSDETFTPELIGGKRVVLRFRQAPPTEWLTANSKRTGEEIRRDCREVLSRDFDEVIPENISDQDYFELLRRLQRRYLEAHPEAALRQEPNNRLFLDMQKYYPPEQMYVEYTEYFRSDVARATRDEFIHRVETVVQQYRKRLSE